jgi:membrane associated rhomboid family serine protease
MRWSNSPTLGVAFVILSCSCAGALGLYFRMGPEAPARAEVAAAYGLYIAAGSTASIALFLAIWKVGRLMRPRRQEDVP